MTEPDLHVPAKAMEELLELNTDANVHDARRIATSIVATELRRLAKEYDKARKRGDEMLLPSTAFRRRADRLEGKR